MRGVFLPEDLARERAIQLEKGITYFKNWEICEVQLQDLEKRIQNKEAEIQLRILDLEAEKEVTRKMVITLDQALEDRDLAAAKYQKERAKNKLLPWIAGGSFLLGGFITHQLTK